MWSGDSGKRTTGGEDRAGHGIFPALADHGQFGVEKFAVKTGIVGNQGRIADPVGKPRHDRFAGLGLGHQSVADSGERFDKPADAKTGIHQFLKPVDNALVFNPHRPHFNRPVAVGRRHAGGLKVKNNNRGVGSYGQLRRHSCKKGRGLGLAVPDKTALSGVLR